MESRRTAVGTTIATFIVIIIIAASVVAIAVLSSSPSGSSRLSQSASTSASCAQPPYLAKLASLVEANPRFALQSHGFSYILAYGDNESGTTGEVEGKPYSSPPETTLSFYSYGSAPSQPCPQVQGLTGVVGALWVGVPINPNLAYNFSGMTVYFTPGVFVNETSTQTGTNSTEPASGSCLNPPPGFSIQQFAEATANSSEPGELALSIQPGTAAMVCVRYSGTQYSRDLGVTTLQPSVYVETCTQLAGGGGSCQGTQSKTINVTSSPQSIRISNETDVIVAYTINAPAGSSGFYMFGIPDNCPSVPLAVGYQPSQLAASDFPGIGPIPCPAPIVQVDIVGISGASSIYIGY
jgi:hypothetical protein